MRRFEIENHVDHASPSLVESHSNAIDHSPSTAVPASFTSFVESLSRRADASEAQLRVLQQRQQHKQSLIDRALSLLVSDASCVDETFDVADAVATTNLEGLVPLLAPDLAAAVQSHQPSLKQSSSSSSSSSSQRHSTPASSILSSITIESLTVTYLSSTSSPLDSPSCPLQFNLRFKSLIPLFNASLIVLSDDEHNTHARSTTTNVHDVNETIYLSSTILLSSSSSSIDVPFVISLGRSTTMLNEEFKYDIVHRCSLPRYHSIDDTTTTYTLLPKEDLSSSSSSSTSSSISLHVSPHPIQHHLCDVTLIITSSSSSTCVRTAVINTLSTIKMSVIISSSSSITHSIHDYDDATIYSNSSSSLHVSFSSSSLSSSVSHLHLQISSTTDALISSFLSSFSPYLSSDLTFTISSFSRSSSLSAIVHFLSIMNSTVIHDEDRQLLYDEIATIQQHSKRTNGVIGDENMMKNEIANVFKLFVHHTKRTKQELQR